MSNVTVTYPTLYSLLKDNPNISLQSYSGRGMYGRECFAITGSHHDCAQAIPDAIKQAAKTLLMGVDTGYLAARAVEVFEDLVDTLMDYSQDSLGHDVVFYWKNLEWEEDFLNK